MKKHGKSAAKKSPKEKPSGKSNNKQGRAGTSKVSGNATSSGKKSKSTSKPIQLDTRTVRSNNKSGNKVSGRSNKGTKTVAVKRRSKPVDELQELFLQQLEAREQRKSSRKKKGKTNTKRKSGSKATDRRDQSTAVRPAGLKIRKQRNKEVVEIIPDDPSVQAIVQGLIAFRAKIIAAIERVVGDRIPSKVYILLKMFNPNDDGGGHDVWDTTVSPPDMSVSSAEVVADFIIQAIIEYNDNVVDLFIKKYAEDTERLPWEVRAIYIRFTFPVPIDVIEE